MESPAKLTERPHDHRQFRQQRCESSHSSACSVSEAPPLIVHVILTLSALSASMVAKTSDKGESNAAATSTSVGNNRSSSIFSGAPGGGGTGDSRPIPPKRTKRRQKARSQSTTVLLPQKSGSSSTNSKQPIAVFKRPLGEQHSSPPELGGRVKPPRPPPPVRQIPPRTYTQLDVKTSRAPVVIDTRGQRRHSKSPQPERPPLPYETFVSQPHIRSDGHDTTTKSQDNKQQATSLNTSPAKYEEVVAGAVDSTSSVTDDIPTNTIRNCPPSPVEKVMNALSTDFSQEDSSKTKGSQKYVYEVSDPEDVSYEATVKEKLMYEPVLSHMSVPTEHGDEDNDPEQGSDTVCYL